MRQAMRVDMACPGQSDRKQTDCTAGVLPALPNPLPLKNSVIEDLKAGTVQKRKLDGAAQATRERRLISQMEWDHYGFTVCPVAVPRRDRAGI
ncbi:hypothetical protein OpiT1DRAFT_00012 [Opitutaceae bacterium TAV1]|nr:hypothetical protein OpiT1DRAFT_00012 [Opitutaceae bacterium TAV1]